MEGSAPSGGPPGATPGLPRPVVVSEEDILRLAEAIARSLRLSVAPARVRHTVAAAIAGLGDSEPEPPAG
eukprot:14136493-Heterocapsa_arctica.AAC.1